MLKKWFKKAVAEKPPYTLGGWKKTQSNEVRRRNALSSRPRTWGLKRKRLSVARALQALANVTKDNKTKILATKDAKYFLKLYRAELKLIQKKKR